MNGRWMKRIIKKKKGTGRKTQKVKQKKNKHKEKKAERNIFEEEVTCGKSNEQ